jgi:hypothetical protein
LANPKGQANKAGEVKDEEVVAETPAESAQVATVHLMKYSVRHKEPILLIWMRLARYPGYIVRMRSR